MNKNFAPDPNRPLMMIRFRIGQERPDIWKRTFEAIKANRACFDEVWFSTGIGFPTLETHRKYSADMAAAAADLRKIGVIPSLQIQTTIGHSDAIIAFSGVEGKNWGSYVGRNGEPCQYVNCPRQPGFLEYFRKLSEIYAEWHPGSVWIDDDLRLHNHHPAQAHGGCFCKDCLALFAKEEGKLYTREELVAACEKDPALNARWDAFGIRSLEGIARVIAEAFHSISPETRLGLQHCRAKTRNGVFQTLQKYSGHRSASRPGGGVYSDVYPFGIIDKGVECAMQKAQQVGYDVLDQICPEIESCPRTFTCKSPQGHRLESLIYLALGMDSLSYFIMDPFHETPEWYSENLLAPLAAETPAYKEYIRFNEGTEPGGVGLFGMKAPVEELGFPLMGTAFAGFSSASSAFLVTEKCVENASDEELERGLKGNIIVNAAAVQAIQKRGFGKYLGDISIVPVKSGFRAVFTEHPFCKGFEKMPFPTFGENCFSIEHPAEPVWQDLTQYEDREAKRIGAETVLYTRPDGTRVVLMGRSFAAYYLSSGYVSLMNRIADWASHGSLPVLTARPARLTLIPRIAPDKTLRSVTVVNSTIGPQKDIKLILRNVPENVKTAKWVIPAEPVRELPVQRDSAVSVTIPELAAWGVGFIELSAGG